jgi:preprotein translocase subunit SecF
MDNRKNSKCDRGFKMTFQKIARLGVAVIVTMLLSEVAPEAVNAVLILILVGLVLGHYSSFAFMADWLGKLSGDRVPDKNKKS